VLPHSATLSIISGSRKIRSLDENRFAGIVNGLTELAAGISFAVRIGRCSQFASSFFRNHRALENFSRSIECLRYKIPIEKKKQLQSLAHPFPSIRAWYRATATLKTVYISVGNIHSSRYTPIWPSIMTILRWFR
jgi:hypothetical protein